MSSCSLHPLEEALARLHQAYPKKVLAISGGRDSMALLYAAHRIIKITGDLPSHWVVAHFNHHTRAQCDKEQQLVEQVTRDYGMSFHTQKAPQQSSASEQNLRVKRWEFLESVRSATQGQAVVTAHHGQDALETLLMRRLRGTGLAGLRGMQVEQGTRLKPWLPFSPSLIENYVNTHEIKYLEDESNHSDLYLRNRLRRRVLPGLHELSQEFGGQDAFYEKLQRSQEELDFAYKRVEQEIQDWMDHHVVLTEFFARVKKGEWDKRNFHEKSFFFDALMHQTEQPTLTSSEKTRCIEHIDGATGRFDLKRGGRGEVSCGWVVFQSPSQRQKMEQMTQSSSMTPRFQLASLFSLHWQKDFNGLMWRFPRPGDRYEGKKLKDLFVKKHIPRMERALIPVVLNAHHEVIATLLEPPAELLVSRISHPYTFFQLS